MRRANGRSRTRRKAARALWPDVDEDALLVVPMMVGDEHVGVICCIAEDRMFSEEDAEMLRAVANQTAVALKKAELIERLTAENTVKDMFDALALGSVDGAEAKATEAGVNLARPHLFLHAERGASTAPWAEVTAAVETRLRQVAGTVLTDSRPDRVRALVPVTDSGEDSIERIRLACEPIGSKHGLVVGLSEAAGGAGSARRRMREAADAARIGSSLVAEGGAVSYEQLGAYRYLVHLEIDDAPQDRYRQSVEKLIDYDDRRGSRLIETLEQYLADRGSVTTSARALYVHPNTVRQRLERIERVAELDLSSEDLLSLELALKLVRLHQVRAERD
jgi:sugar diacid utilization regulator